jgi:hypothetical protein
MKVVENQMQRAPFLHLSWIVGGGIFESNPERPDPRKLAAKAQYTTIA